MKNLFKIALIAGLFTLAGCSKDDDTPTAISSAPMNFTVDGYSKVSVDGKMKVEFNRQESSSNEYAVNIIGTPQQRANINVQSTNGVLYITSNNIQLIDNVVIQIFTNDLDEIRLESNQTATFWGIIDDELDVVTEGNSTLNLFNIRVENLTCKTEGESELNVTTWKQDFVTTQTFTEQQAIQLNDTTLLVDNSYIIIGNNINLANGTWSILGTTISKYFRMTYCDYITEGQTTIDARYAAAKDINIKLEGDSQAYIWAFDEITGTGEGSSHLFYRPVFGLDYSGFSTQGSAQITPMP